MRESQKERVIFAAVLVAAVAGVWALYDSLHGWIVLAAIAVAVLALWPPDRGRVSFYVLSAVGAVLVAILALAGLNVITNLIGIDEVPILAGLIVAVLVFGAVAFWYLKRYQWPTLAAALTGGILAVVLILGGPWAFGELNKPDTDSVPLTEEIASELDVFIVGPGRRHPNLPKLSANPATSEFDVRYSVGVARGGEVRWALAESRDAEEAIAAIAAGADAPAAENAPAPRHGADAVLLLLVDGTPPVSEDPKALPEVPARPREVARWKRMAKSAGLPNIPVYALLHSEDESRIDTWRKIGSPGRGVSAQKLGSATVTDAAVRLAIFAPTSQADFALAMEYRPILLFDKAESVPWPLSINALFKAEKVELCTDEGVLETRCEVVQHPAELENGGNHLRLDRQDSDELKALARRELKAQEEEAAPVADAPAPGAGSTIYVHPFSTKRKGRDLLYLDYWWYLPDNPGSVGGGAFCGPGFVIPGLTCYDHQSDWEGITVLVDRTEAVPQVRAVQYAQHDAVVKYDWEELRATWDGDKRIQSLVAGIPDAFKRPIAFVAKGSHAAYPTPCSQNCHQVEKEERGEGRHRGDFGWVGNKTDACGRSSCLQMLPTRAGGEKPALWNAYDGPWGERQCVLTYYCDSGQPPSAPGDQERYKYPFRYDVEGDAELRAYRAKARRNAG